MAEDVDEIKQLRAYYHGSIRFIDDQIGRIVRFLGEKSLLDNTIIVFTSDHGEMMGDHALICKGAPHYDSGIRCPLIVNGRGIRAGKSDRLGCSLDIFPTICDWAGIPQEARPPLEGKSFAAACAAETEPAPWREITVQNVTFQPEAETGVGTGGLVQSIITDDQFRLTVFEEPGYGELFDLAADPQEQNNLYHDPAAGEKLKELSIRHIHAHMRMHRFQHTRNFPFRPAKGKKGPVDGFFYLDKDF